MTLISRRSFILGLLATGLAVPPILSGGMAGHLKRTLAGHFGDTVLEVEGITSFINEYVATAGKQNVLKKAAAQLYFSFYGPVIAPYSGLKDFEETFLQTILIRSNIIAVVRGQKTTFEYHNVDPYDPECGSFLSASAEEPQA